MQQSRLVAASGAPQPTRRSVIQDLSTYCGTTRRQLKVSWNTDMNQTRLLNLGCGHVNPEGWINVDGSNRAWLASKWPSVNRTLVFLRLLPPTDFSSNTLHVNLLSGRYPWEDRSIDGIYMGEILEHFSEKDGEQVLRECYRVLKQDGIIRIRVPDNARFWKNYLDEYHAVLQRPSRNGISSILDG